jgi:hypothetical protein
MTTSNTSLPSPTRGSSWSVLAEFPEYRRLLIAQFVVQTGDAIQLAVIDWHIWQLTGSTLALGLIGLATAVFGFSEGFVLSLLALAIVGFIDSVSAAIRNMIRQGLTLS